MGFRSSAREFGGYCWRRLFPRAAGVGGAGHGEADRRRHLEHLADQFRQIKVPLAAAKADEKRLAKAVEHEAANVDVWARRIGETEASSDAALAEWVRDVHRSHLDALGLATALLELRRAEIERLREALMAVNLRIEAAHRQ